MRVVSLRKTFGARVAVESVSFEAPDGVVTGVLGPNGAGKTTTLRVLTGSLRPTSGGAFVDGYDVSVDPVSARKRLGVLAETVGLYERLTAREHLWFAGELHGLAGETLRLRADAVLAQLGLQDVAHSRAGSLSFGQKRRLALARALLHEPPNVILDEPTNGLDVASIRRVRAEIRRLAAEGRAVIVSSHVMPEVSMTCDRVVVLARGLVVDEGAPAVILARTGSPSLEEAFVKLIGSEEGLN
jgi:sodium transport system ATP-binding protein